MKATTKKKAPVNNPKGLNGGAHRPRTYTKEVAEKIGYDLLEWFDQSPKNIFIISFCNRQKIPQENMSEMCERYPSFRHLYVQAKQKQQEKLLMGGIVGDFKEQMTKFVLVNHHDYAEKSKQDVNQTGQVTVRVVNYAG